MRDENVFLKMKTSLMSSTCELKSKHAKKTKTDLLEGGVSCARTVEADHWRKRNWPKGELMNMENLALVAFLFVIKK